MIMLTSTLYYIHIVYNICCPALYYTSDFCRVIYVLNLHAHLYCMIGAKKLKVLVEERTEDSKDNVTLKK